MTTIELHWYSAPPTGSSLLLLDTLDLFGKADGLQMAYNGLTRAVGDRDANTVKETFTLRADGADFDDLAAVLQTLDLWQKRVDWSLNETDLNEVWILMQMGDETGAMEAQVLDLQYNVADDILNYSDPHVNQLTILLQRTPWEAEKDTAIPSLIYSAAALGGIDEATVSAGDGNVTSDLPARVLSLRAYSESPLTEFWLALQSNRLRDPAAFVPVWPLSAANVLSADSQFEADGDAYSGTRVTCDFSSAETALQRVQLSLTNVAGVQEVGFDSAAFYAQTGHYEALLRARVSAASTEIHLRLGYGWLRDWPWDLTSIVWRDLTLLTSTSYLLLDMQSIAIPPTKVAGSHANFAIAIEAERVSGSGSLYLDCVGVLPLDEGAIHIQAPDSTAMSGGAPTRLVRVDVAPDGRRSGYMVYSGTIGDQVAIDAEIWEMPTNGVLPNLVAFGQRAGACQLYDSLIVQTDYCRRFRLMRGTN